MKRENRSVDFTQRNKNSLSPEKENYILSLAKSKSFVNDPSRSRLAIRSKL